MSELVTELRIVTDEETIFHTNSEYVIPIYQRAFAWEEEQINQLIEDIYDVPNEADYYIGSLIVSKHGNTYEVVDGQQRLTTLFLLLNYLRYDVPAKLTFACRDKSNYTFKHIKDLIDENAEILDSNQIEKSILEGIEIIKEKIGDDELYIKKLQTNLKRVVIYRIEVPENTDLNSYFEIMNTRGEQLEKPDILKATLMSYLNGEKDKSIFAEIWDACSDMTGYVQTNFLSDRRWIYFVNGWNSMPSESWDDYDKNQCKTNESEESLTLEDIIKSDSTIDYNDGNPDGDRRVRFESIIDFPYFLLHTLKVYVSLNHIFHEDGLKIVDDLLDDKKLTESFDRVILHIVNKEGRIKNNTESFSKGFIICLLRTRYLFDKYIIKREYENENSDGHWSLKSYDGTGYVNTVFKIYYEHNQEIKSKKRNKQNLMIQSALRVSYTSPKVMHWITELLIWLSNDEEKNPVSLNGVTEEIAKEAVKKQFFGVCENISNEAMKKQFFGVCENYAMGVKTPHIVFNYLDYLLWNNDTDDTGKYNDFSFEFRNSVEHWYPQHPSEGTFEPWDGVDRFGNLCIIQRNVNSRFSNLDPEAKKSTFTDMISKGSLKLRKMSELTKESGDKTASQNWKDKACEEHEKEMIEILIDACYPLEESNSQS